MKYNGKIEYIHPSKYIAEKWYIEPTTLASGQTAYVVYQFPDEGEDALRIESFIDIEDALECALNLH